MKLPLDLAGFGFPGCDPLASPDIVLGYVADGAGEATFGGTMPAVGGTLHFQLFASDAGSGVLGGFSAGLAVTSQPAPAAGSVIVTEILSNPEFTLQKDGEWFEARNLTDDPLNLEGWTLEDDAGSHVVDTGGAGLVIAPQGTLVCGRKKALASNGGVPVDYAFGNDLQLSNAVDTVALRSFAGTLVDTVTYDDGATFPDPRGASLSLDPYFHDATANDVGARWRAAVDVIGGPQGNTDLGTPGAGNECRGPPPPADASGVWTVTTWTTSASTDCTDDLAEPPTVYTATITQTGTSVTLTTFFATLTGTMTGDQPNLTGSFNDPKDGGVTTVLSSAITVSGNSMSGTLDWAWTDGFFDCPFNQDAVTATKP